MPRHTPIQLPRHLVQGGFLLFFLWIGIRFYQWKQALTTTGIAPFARPDAVASPAQLQQPESCGKSIRVWLETQLHAFPEREHEWCADLRG